MYDKLMKQTAIFGTIFFLTAMSCLLYYIVHHNREGTSIATTDNLGEYNIKSDAKELPIQQGTDNTAYFGIPLSTTTKEDKILVENNYVEQKIYITIQDLEESFFKKNKIVSDITCVEKVLYEYQDGVSRLELQLNNIYEHTAFYKNNMLYLEFVPPREMYDKLIVIDARGGGMNTGPTAEDLSEKSIALAVMKRVKERLDTTNIRAYYTRSDDNNPSAERRVALANLSKADMLISIGVAEAWNNKQIKGIQTVYNPTFFIPQVGSVELADVLERETARFTGAEAIGLIPAKEDDVLLNEAVVPVATVEIGYISNEEERLLLENEEYLDKVANGIYMGIMKAYQNMEAQ